VLCIKFSAGRQFSASKSASSPSAKTLVVSGGPTPDQTKINNDRLMTTTNTRRLELLTCLALVCLLVSAATIFLWIRAFNAGTSQPERVQIYLGYFPSFLGLGGISVIEIILCITAIVLSSICLRLREIGWKLLNLVIIIGSAFRLLLILWGHL